MKFLLTTITLSLVLLTGCPAGMDDQCQCNNVSKDLENKFFGGSCSEGNPKDEAPSASCFYRSSKCCEHWGYKWEDPPSWGSE